MGCEIAYPLPAALYWICDYLSMLKLKLIHINKRSPLCFYIWHCVAKVRITGMRLIIHSLDVLFDTHELIYVCPNRVSKARVCNTRGNNRFSWYVQSRLLTTVVKGKCQHNIIGVSGTQFQSCDILLTFTLRQCNLTLLKNLSGTGAWTVI